MNQLFFKEIPKAKPEDYCLRRAPGICCPEPTCDNHPATQCLSCGKLCAGCKYEIEKVSK